MHVIILITSLQKSDMQTNQPKHHPTKRKRNYHGSRTSGGGGSNMKPISYTLTWALRHAAIELRLRMTSDGYCPVQDLIENQHPKLRKIISLDQIRPVVETSDKQRFRLELRPSSLYSQEEDPDQTKPWAIIPLTPEQAAPVAISVKVRATLDRVVPDATLIPENTKETDGKADQCLAAETSGLIWCIRANQGHSLEGINSDFLLQEIAANELATLPVIVHGTYFDAWRKIQASGGLSRMGRTHIHCAAGFAGDNSVISGMRASSQVYVFISGVRCAEAGVRFYRSDNGVLLTAGVGDEGFLPIKYISHVRDRSGETLLDQRDQAQQKD